MSNSETVLMGYSGYYKNFDKTGSINWPRCVICIDSAIILVVLNGIKFFWNPGSEIGKLSL